MGKDRRTLSLVERLTKTRVRQGHKVFEINFGEVHIDNPDNRGDVMGRIAERYVFEWIELTPGLETYFPFESNPAQYNHFSIKSGPQGVTISDLETLRNLHEIDFMLLDHDRRPYVAQVKALKMNGVKAQIEASKRFARDILGTSDIGLLVFLPTYNNRREDARRLVEEVPGVACVDMGYKKKHLNRAVSRFYDGLGSPRLVTG